MNERSTHILDKLDAMAVACAGTSDDVKRVFHLEYLALVGELLLEQGRGTALLGPLLDIHEGLDEAHCSQPGRKLENERRADMQTASPHMMARVCSVIDILIASGLSSDHAAQIVSRQMMSRRLILPVEGGDARGWKRVEIWRHRLVTLAKAHPQFEASQKFKEQLLAEYGAETATHALSQPLWDRRALA